MPSEKKGQVPCSFPFDLQTARGCLTWGASILVGNHHESRSNCPTIKSTGVHLGLTLTLGFLIASRAHDENGAADAEGGCLQKGLKKTGVRRYGEFTWWGSIWRTCMYMYVKACKNNLGIHTYTHTYIYIYTVTVIYMSYTLLEPVEQRSELRKSTNLGWCWIAGEKPVIWECNPAQPPSFVCGLHILLIDSHRWSNSMKPN